MKRLVIAKRTAIALGLSIAAAGAAQAEPWRYGDYRDYQTNSGSYTKKCKSIRKENQIAGAVIGGVAGGLLGNEAAARGVEEEGRILGALVGAIAGSEIGKRQSDCEPEFIQPYNTYETSYQPGVYRRDEPLTSSQHLRNYPQEPYDYGYISGAPEDDALYGGDYGDYSNINKDASKRQCQTVTRITYLPDGREIHEPTLACREMQYGPWSVEPD